MIERLRAWGNSYTEQGRYSPVGIAFHWIMAALILFQIGWGFWTDWMMPGGDKVFAYQVHSAAGLPVLLLAVLRILWRMLITDPYNDADRQGWQTTIAHVTAMLFYLTFFTLPLSGWVMWSSVAAPGPVTRRPRPGPAAAGGTRWSAPRPGAPPSSTGCARRTPKRPRSAAGAAP